MEKTSEKARKAVATPGGQGNDSKKNHGLPKKTSAAIEKLHQLDLKAMKTHDIDMLVRLLTDDCIMLPPAMEPLCGHEAIRDYLNDKFMEWKNYEVAQYDHQFEEVKVIGELAYEWGTSRGVYYMKNDGPDIFENSRIFRILRSQPDGSWKFARIMWHDVP
jgi:ketosteroid isomerase-like protein